MDKEIVVHQSQEILLSSLKKKMIKPARDTEHSFIHISKWMKLSLNAYILHESSYKTFQERGIYGKKRDIYEDSEINFASQQLGW